MSNLSMHLNKVELLELQTLLEDYNLSKFNGFLHGLNCLPNVLPPSEWMNDFLPEQALKSKAKTQQAVDLFFRYYNVVIAQGDQIPPSLDTDGSVEQSWQWLSGFGQAFAYDSEALEALSDAEVEENKEDDNVFISAIIFGFAIDIENAPEGEDRDSFLELKEAMRGLFEKQKAAERTSLLQGFLLTVKELLEPARSKAFDRMYDMFVTSSSRKHSSLGRNDPCHCGSGKKYKHCHAKP